MTADMLNSSCQWCDGVGCDLCMGDEMMPALPNYADYSIERLQREIDDLRRIFLAMTMHDGCASDVLYARAAAREELYLRGLQNPILERGPDGRIVIAAS